MPNRDADRLDEAVADLVQHGRDDLPEGPPSDLGGEVRPNPLTRGQNPKYSAWQSWGNA